MTLSEAFVPTIDPASGLRLRGEGRSLDELFITAATVHEGKLHALSANFGTLLTIDLASRMVVAAATIPGLTQPVGVAVTPRGVHVVCADGTMVVASRPPM